jgi:hypothetical protein
MELRTAKYSFTDAEADDVYAEVKARYPAMALP